MVTKDSTEVVSSTYKIPDGGWGWMIVLSAFFVMFMIDGLFGSFGLFLPVLMERLNSSPSSTSLAGSIVVGSLLFIAIIACPLIERFGSRIVSLCGAFLACVGLLLSSVVDNIWLFLVTYGIITGSGMGLMYLSSIVIVNQYFDQRRGIAQSIMSAGSGIGVMVLSPVTEYLINLYDWRGALMILGGLFLQLCVACAMFRPIKSLPNKLKERSLICDEKVIDIEIVVEKEHNSNIERETGVCFDSRSRMSTNQTISPKTNDTSMAKRSLNYSTNSLPRNMFFKSSFTDSTTFSSNNCVKNYYTSLSSFRETNDFCCQKDIFYCGSIKRLHLDKYSQSIKELGFQNKSDYQLVSSESLNVSITTYDNNKGESLLLNKSFWMIAIGAFLTQMAQFIPNMFLGDIGLINGLTSKDVSWIFSMFGIVNTVGRLLPGIIVDKTSLSATTLCFIGMVGSAVPCLLFPLCHDFESLMTFTVVFAFFIAFFGPLQPIMVFDSIGLENLTKGFSIITVIKGPAAISGPPLAGALYERTKDYNVTIIFAGILCLATACIYTILPLGRLLIFLCRPSLNESTSVGNIKGDKM